MVRYSSRGWIVASVIKVESRRGRPILRACFGRGKVLVARLAPSFWGFEINCFLTSLSVWLVGDEQRDGLAMGWVWVFFSWARVTYFGGRLTWGTFSWMNFSNWMVRYFGHRLNFQPQLLMWAVESLLAELNLGSTCKTLEHWAKLVESWIVGSQDAASTHPKKVRFFINSVLGRMLGLWDQRQRVSHVAADSD